MNKHIFRNFLLPFVTALALGGCVTLHNHYAENPNATTTTSRSVAATQVGNHTADCNCNHQHNVSYSDAATQRCEHGYHYGGVHHPTPPIYRDERDYAYYDYSNNYPWRYGSGSHEPYVIYVPTGPQPNRNDEPARRTDAGGNNGGSQPQDGVQSQPRRTQEPIYRAQRPEVLPTVNDGRQSEPRRPLPTVEEPTYRAQRPEVLPTVNDGRQSEPRRPLPTVEEPTYRAQRPEVLPTVNDGRQSEPRRTVPVVDTPSQHTTQAPSASTVVTGPSSQPRSFEQSEVPVRVQQPTVRPEATPVATEESKPRRVVVSVKANETAAPAVVEQAPVESTVRVEKQAAIPDNTSVQSQKSEKVIDSSVSTTVAAPRALQAMPVEQGQSSSVRRVVPR